MHAVPATVPAVTCTVRGQSLPKSIHLLPASPASLHSATHLSDPAEVHHHAYTQSGGKVPPSQCLRLPLPAFHVLRSIPIQFTLRVAASSRSPQTHSGRQSQGILPCILEPSHPASAGVHGHGTLRHSPGFVVHGRSLEGESSYNSALGGRLSALGGRVVVHGQRWDWGIVVQHGAHIRACWSSSRARKTNRVVSNEVVKMAQAG